MATIEAVIDLVMRHNSNAIMVIKSTIPVGYIQSVCEKTSSKDIIFSPEFLRESKALYDNLYPSRIIVGTDMNDEHPLPFNGLITLVFPGVHALAVAHNSLKIQCLESDKIWVALAVQKLCEIT